jgi:two-component system, cell cycle sensor histidine kinase and response regulator CckA
MKPLTIYLIPPILSLVVSLTLAGIAIGAKPRTAERKLFSAVCLWWGLLSPAFISHHLLTSIPQILAIERFIHFFYVFLPALHIVFVHHLLGIHKKSLVIGAFLFSGLLAATTPTNWYIHGLYQYDWGYIAKGGPAFQLFGLYGMVTIAYFVYQTVRRVRKESNRVRKRKQRYIIFSFCMSGMLTMLNIPAMNGIDLYPAGNFLFVPLSILAYGVLKYRLMDIRSIMLRVASWAILSSLILVPNLFFLLWMFNTVDQISRGLFLMVFSLWFLINYHYIRRLQPFINSRFGRNRHDLNLAVKEFIANAIFLKDLEALVTEFQDLMNRYMAIPNAAVFLCREHANAMVNPISGKKVGLSDPVSALLASRPFSASVDMIETHPLYAKVAPELLKLMVKNGFRYMLPLVQADQLVGLVLLPQPDHGADLSPADLKLLDRLSAAGLAFSNSATYKNTADLKANLEKRTIELTREVEERQRIEEALRKSEEKHRLMAENIKDVIWTMDMALAFTYISPAAEKMQGWTTDEFMGFCLEQILTPASMEKANETMSEVLSHGERTGDFSRHVTLELEMYKKTGKTIQAEVAASFMLDSQGQPCGILGVTRDVTERSQALREREALQDQLARAKKMEALGLLAGGVAHDLNNILSGIMSYPEVIMMKLPEDSPLRKPLQTIQRSGQRAASVVNDLVTIARGVASSREVAELNFLIGEYLSSAEHANLLANHPKAHVDVRLGEDLWNISCSRIHIEKVLMNLLANAMEALDQSGVVTVSTENRIVDRPLRGYDTVREGKYTVLSVSDTGSGISSGDLDRIFEPFYTKKMMGRSGTGLGLAIVWNTVQDHHGYITVTSGKTGTRFDLYFPSTVAKMAADESSTPIDAFRGHGETILVVDDDPTQREIASAMLSFLGYRVDAVDSGEAAVAYVQEARVDLMLLDMMMPPGMNGRQTYSAVGRIRPGQRAVIASGFSETDEVEKAQRMGAGGLLKKPYTIEKLGNAVKSALA